MQMRKSQGALPAVWPGRLHCGDLSACVVAATGTPSVRLQRPIAGAAAQTSWGALVLLPNACPSCGSVVPCCLLANAYSGCVPLAWRRLLQKQVLPQPVTTG